MQSGPGPVLVGTSYEYRLADVDSCSVKQARKYSSFQNHDAYWECLDHHNIEGIDHNLHEIFPADRPRCLYFDLDGPTGYREAHREIITLLQYFVRWFFDGDRHDWAQQDPEPLVLVSHDPNKYSCHIVFPQVQFRDFEHQSEYIQVLLNALPLVTLDFEGGESVPILARVVDPAVYSKFQLFRGPYACKLKSGLLRPETKLEPEDCFRSDPLAVFAGRIEQDYALELPPVSQLLRNNEVLRHHHETKRWQIMASSVTPGAPSDGVSPQDQALLYDLGFQRKDGGTIDLAGLSDLEQFEQTLRYIHPDRASQWWSWFRISGVTCKMLQRYAHDPEARRRIWEAHFAWSRSYPGFDAAENVDMVENAYGKRISGLPLLMRLVHFDNPNRLVRTML